MATGNCVCERRQAEDNTDTRNFIRQFRKCITHATDIASSKLGLKSVCRHVRPQPTQQDQGRNVPRLQQIRKSTVSHDGYVMRHRNYQRGSFLMKDTVKVGMVGEEQFVVSEQHLIDFAHDGMPQILCTPWLIWFLEHAARNAILPLLEPGESTVGVVVNVEHMAATPLGAKVVCRARVIYSDGPLISFQFEARDEHEKIAIGTHKLQVIQAARLAKRVTGKLS